MLFLRWWRAARAPARAGEAECDPLLFTTLSHFTSSLRSVTPHQHREDTNTALARHCETTRQR